MSDLKRVTDGVLGPDDRRITREEVLSKQLLWTGEALERLGVVRTAAGSTGNQGSRVDIAGLGEFSGEYLSADAPGTTDARRQLLDALEQRFVFPIVAGDGQQVAGDSLTESDRRRLQFADDPEAEGDEIVREVQAFAGGSGGSTSGGTGMVVAILIGAVALAVAVLGGS